MRASAATITEFVCIPEIPEGWDEAEFILRLQAAVDALEDDTTWEDECGDTISPTITVRSPRQGEARETYEVRADRTLQVLGFAVPEPDELSDLLRRAFDAVCT